MHDIATYLMRSRIDNISAALNNLIFVDPTQVSVPDSSTETHTALSAPFQARSQVTASSLPKSQT